MKKLIVPQKYDNKKLTKFILDSFPKLSPNMLYKALRQKDIKIDGKRINMMEMKFRCLFLIHFFVLNKL